MNVAKTLQYVYAYTRYFLFYEGVMGERDTIVAERDIARAARAVAVSERDTLRAQLAEMHQKETSSTSMGKC